METRNTIKERIMHSTNVECCDVDMTNNLSLYHYCGNGNQTETLEKNIRGVILDSDFINFNVIVPSLPYTEDIILQDRSQQFPFTTDGSTNKYYVSFEGTVIRVFFYNGWRVATTRKINAYNSRWGGPVSFGTLFEEAVEKTLNTTFDEFLSTLSVEKQYMFLLRPSLQTKILSPVVLHGPRVFVIGVFENDSFVVTDVSNIPAMPEMDTYEHAFDFDVDRQGCFVLSTTPDGKLNTYKLITPLYNTLSKKLRGNCWNVEQRYFELRKKGDYETILQFLFYFPEHIILFSTNESIFNQFVTYLCYMFNERFYFKRYARVPSNLYRFFLGLVPYAREDKFLTYKRVETYLFSNEIGIHRLMRLLKIFINL